MTVSRERPACSYCGLPTPVSWLGRISAEGQPLFCCFGCRLAAAVTRSSGEKGAVNWTLTCLGLSIFLTMNVMVFSMALWAQDFYGPDPGAGPLTTTVEGLFRYLCLLFSLPVLFLLGKPIWENAWQTLCRGALSTDLLLILGVGAAFVYSGVSVFRDQGKVYFEVGCMVLVLLTLGRWLEASGKLRATEAIESLQKMLPEKVRLLQGAEEAFWPLEKVQAGQCLRVLPGERIPCDGRVRGQPVSVDEQVLTGESTIQVKEPGAWVWGGTLNLDGDLVVEVGAPPGQGSWARLIELMRQACRSRGYYQRLADRAAGWFTLAVVLLAGLALAVHSHRHGLGEGILTALAVLVIACPCALGIATPLAIWMGLGLAGRGQVLFRSGEALERLAAVRALCFDKTGTLTTGAPTVLEMIINDNKDSKKIKTLAARLAASSTHAHSRAIDRFFRGEEKTVADNIREIRTLPGRGIVAIEGDSGRELALGSLRLMSEKGFSLSKALEAAAGLARQKELPLTCLGWDGAVGALFVFQEQLRSEVGPVLARLRELGLDVQVLTGDHEKRGAALAQTLRVRVEADLLPADKLAAIARARAQIGPVAMVGDGINDAPALAASDVGIALGCGTDVARDSAGVCLLGNDLRRLPWAIMLARRTVRTIRQNLFWAFLYNVLGIGLALSGALNPVWAALAMVLSSLLVVGNSLRLRHDVSWTEKTGFLPEGSTSCSIG